MVHFLTELLVCWTWFRQFDELSFVLNWLIMRCKLWHEPAADSMISPKCRLKSSWVQSVYFNHPSEGNSTNYYIILSPRDKAVPPTSQQQQQKPPKRVKYLATPSSIFISSSSPGELSALRQSETRFVELGEYSENTLSEDFWTPNIASSQFDEYPKLYSRSKSVPN